MSHRHADGTTHDHNSEQYPLSAEEIAASDRDPHTHAAYMWDPVRRENVLTSKGHGLNLDAHNDRSEDK